MDRAQDVLVVYRTSYGGSNFRLAASHWSLDVVLAELARRPDRAPRP